MTPPRRPYQLFMLGLCVVALAVLAARALVGVESQAGQVLGLADSALCLIFFTDFVASFVKAEDRWGYFRTWGWLDLLSSIPAVDILRLGRAARIFRIVRVIRGIRASKILAESFLGHRRESVALVAALVTFVVVVASATAVLEFELNADGNIKSAGDALWWSLTTLTTVGYGDRFPVTTGGRIVGGFLMIAGIGLFGAMSGLVASWVLAPDRSDKSPE